MEALRNQTLLLLGLLAFLLAILLLYRIMKYRPRPTEQIAAETPDTTLITQVPPPPLPKIEKLLTRLEAESPEFVEIVRNVLGHTSPQKLMIQPELRRNFAHLEVLVQRAEKTPPPKGTLGIAGASKFPAAEVRRDVKATMVTIIRQLQEVEGVREKSGLTLDDLVDRFLETV